jgi:hypothetical protein
MVHEAEKILTTDVVRVGIALSLLKWVKTKTNNFRLIEFVPKATVEFE